MYWTTLAFRLQTSFSSLALESRGSRSNASMPLVMLDLSVFLSVCLFQVSNMSAEVFSLLLFLSLVRVLVAICGLCWQCRN